MRRMLRRRGVAAPRASVGLHVHRRPLHPRRLADQQRGFHRPRQPAAAALARARASAAHDAAAHGAAGAATAQRAPV